MLGYGMDMAAERPTSSCLTELMGMLALLPIEVAYTGGVECEVVCAAAQGSVN